MGDTHGLPKSRLAMMPGTTHIGMMQRTDWFIPMIIDFLDADLNAAPPTFWYRPVALVIFLSPDTH